MAECSFACLAPQSETDNYLVLEASAERLRISCYLPDGTQINQAEVKNNS
ncbi:MAG: hypothetical protein SPI01_07950 [Succiniclasticum sp.]|nr:hypothetical protein [Succiniclasticum sp.]MDY6087892.1 hypothetical protein [Succiniclasticum sp.]